MNRAFPEHPRLILKTTLFRALVNEEDRLAVELVDEFGNDIEAVVDDRVVDDVHDRRVGIHGDRDDRTDLLLRYLGREGSVWIYRSMGTQH